MDPDPQWIRINLSGWVRIRIQKGKNDPQNIERSKEFACFEVLDVLFLRAKGFSCSLCVLNGGLQISKLQYEKNIQFFQL
jgi:hypothetical protein